MYAQELNALYCQSEKVNVERRRMQYLCYI